MAAQSSSDTAWSIGAHAMGAFVDDHIAWNWRVAARGQGRVLRIKDWLNWLFCPWHPNPWHPNSIGGYEVIVKRLKVLHRNEPRASRDRLLVRLRIRAALQMLEIALATLGQATDDESSELLQAIRGAKWP